MSKNETDFIFPFAPAETWDYEESRFGIDSASLPLSPEEVRSFVLLNVFGLLEEDLGTAIAGAKASHGGAWTFRYSDSGGNQFGTVHVEIPKPDEGAFLVVRMEAL